MNKFKLFVENFLIYGLGGIISKFVPLIMIPIITRLMPDSSYVGISDMSETMVSFASAIAIMGMYDAMYRMFFEKEDEKFKKMICSTSLAFTICTSIVVFILMIVSRDLLSVVFYGDSKYSNLIFIVAVTTLTNATNSIVSAPTRMQNKRVIFLTINTVTPIIAYSIAIPLMLSGHYLIALPLSAALSGAFMEIIYLIINRQWFTFRKIQFAQLKNLLVIAIPLLPNFLIYWIFNSCDKVMITQMIGVGEAGVYSIGSKLGHVSQLIYTAFAGGWQYFAFSTMHEKDQVETNSKVFEYLGTISFAASMFMCAWSPLIFEILFEGEYVQGYKVAPYLFLAPLLQMLFQVAANQFLVVKKTWPNMLILFVGAIINIVLNLLLIPKLGIEGAAIATLIGYAVSDFICIVVLSKMKLMKISNRFIGVTVTTIVMFMVWRLFLVEKVGGSTIMAIVILLFFIYIYKKELSIIFNYKRK